MPALPNTDPSVASDRHHIGPGLAEPLALAAALGLCVATRLPQRVTEAVGIRDWTFALVVAVAVVSVARALARAPFTRRRNAGPTTLARWAATEVGTLVATFLVGMVVAVPLYALLRATPAWWLPAWIASATATVLWQLAMPVALRARVGSLDPAPEPLDHRLRSLAVRAGVNLPSGVVVAAKAKHRCANAYVVGLGATRQVVLEQAVVEWPPELVEQAVAHELGHVRLGHSARRLPVGLLVQLGTLAAAAAVLSYAPLLHLAGVRHVADPASYPLLLAVGALVVLPARCLLAWQARAQERAADRFALALLKRPDHFNAMLHRAAADSGAPRQLPWWRRLTASHPPIDQRAAVRLQPLGA